MPGEEVRLRPGSFCEPPEEAMRGLFGLQSAVLVRRAEAQGDQEKEQGGVGCHRRGFGYRGDSNAR